MGMVFWFFLFLIQELSVQSKLAISQICSLGDKENQDGAEQFYHKC